VPARARPSGYRKHPEEEPTNDRGWTTLFPGHARLVGMNKPNFGMTQATSLQPGSPINAAEQGLYREACGAWR
jgi:hypothetical protein